MSGWCLLQRWPRMSDMVNLTIDDKAVSVPLGTTIFDAARMNDIPIPTLCHLQNETPVAVCRVCVVDVKARVYGASCIRHCEQNMVVKTNTEEIEAARKGLVELLIADHPTPCVRQQHSGDCELETMARGYGVAESRFAKRATIKEQDESSLSILVDHAACILCDRCVRACSEVRHNNVIARVGKGYAAGIAFDMNTPMGNSSCVSCGECMVSCPTGALTNRKIVGQHLEEQEHLSLDVKELLKLPVFKGVSGTFLELNKGAIVKRCYKKGEVIFREGDFGSTAFYILEGKVDIFLASPRGHVDTEGRANGFFSKLKSKLKGRSDHQREDENLTKKYISIDASIDLEYDNPIAQLGAGELFGEMTCMSF